MGDKKSQKKDKTKLKDQELAGSDGALTNAIVVEEASALGAMGGIDRTRMLGLTIGTLRTAIGAGLVVAPAFSGRLWLGESAGCHASRVLSRALGARDLALGLSTLASLRSRRPTAQLLKLGFVADLADAVAAGVSWRDMEPNRRWVAPTAAGMAGVIGLLAVSGSEMADERDDLMDLGVEQGADRVEGGLGSSADLSRTPSPAGGDRR